jgi:hypothetical protein
MANPQSKAVAKPVPKLTLDTWAVVLALLAAALIRFGLFPHVPW